MSAQKRAKTGPRALTSSPEARRIAVVILEVLTGLIGPTEGAEALGVSLARYYALETRALQGLLNSLEPRPRGRRQTADGRIKELEGEVTRLNREILRTRSLVRVAHRTIGVKTPAGAAVSKAKKKAPKRRRRAVASRGEKMLNVLKDRPPESGATAKKEEK